jgi:hypothetical protein
MMTLPEVEAPITTTTATTTVIKQRRKIKPLPTGLAQLTSTSDLKAVLQFRWETDPHEDEQAEEQGDDVMVAYQACFPDNDDENNDEETVIVLDKLTLDQLRKLCRSVGIQYVNRFSKFQCRKALCELAHRPVVDAAAAEAARRRLSTLFSDKTSNNMIRMINVIFSHHFLDTLLALNDGGGGGGGTVVVPYHFWSKVADAVNNSASEMEEEDGNVLPLDSYHRRYIVYHSLKDIPLVRFQLSIGSRGS